VIKDNLVIMVKNPSAVAVEHFVLLQLVAVLPVACGGARVRQAAWSRSQFVQDFGDDTDDGQAFQKESQTL